ncbi:hypothetical protein [Actinoplanes sp. NPDC020271]|uniref:hypothetical protein n=1 Tax=Actinoplanes sp. NPDC020271 TaxID=3363896 RepID=UPI00378DD5E1
MIEEPPRVLDASALVELFNGNFELMTMLGDADRGRFSVSAPAAAVLEAQVVLKAAPWMWEQVLKERVYELPLQGTASVVAGNFARPRLENYLPHRVLTGPPMVGHVLHEALVMSGTIVTTVPLNYGGHAVPLTVLR